MSLGVKSRSHSDCSGCLVVDKIQNSFKQRSVCLQEIRELKKLCEGQGSKPNYYTAKNTTSWKLSSTPEGLL